MAYVLSLVDTKTLCVVAHLTCVKKHKTSNAFSQHQQPHSSTQSLYEFLLLHPEAPLEVDNNKIPMNTDQGEKHDAAVQVDQQQGDLQSAQKTPKWPVAAKSKVSHHERCGKGDDDITQNQMELEKGSGIPFGHHETEHPKAEAVKEETHHEDQTEEHGDGDILRVHGAGLRRAEVGWAAVREQGT